MNSEFIGWTAYRFPSHHSQCSIANHIAIGTLRGKSVDHRDLSETGFSRSFGEQPVHRLCRFQHAVILVAVADQLNADRQTGRTGEHG